MKFFPNHSGRAKPPAEPMTIRGSSEYPLSEGVREDATATGNAGILPAGLDGSGGAARRLPARRWRSQSLSRFLTHLRKMNSCFFCMISTHPSLRITSGSSGGFALPANTNLPTNTTHFFL